MRWAYSTMLASPQYMETNAIKISKPPFTVKYFYVKQETDVV